jgi:hypothetical protein
LSRKNYFIIVDLPRTFLRRLGRWWESRIKINLGKGDGVMRFGKNIGLKGKRTQEVKKTMNSMNYERD